MKFFAYYFVISFLILSVGIGAENLETEGPLRSPYHSLDFFYQNTDSRQFAKAKEALEFPSIVTEEKQELDAEKLRYLFDRFLWIDWDTLPKEEESKKNQSPLRIGSIPFGERTVPIVIHPILQNGERVWKISKSTIAAVDILYDMYHPPSWKRWIPDSISYFSFLGVESWQWIGLACVISLSFLLSFLFESVSHFIGRKILLRNSESLKDFLLALRKPARLFWFGVLFIILKESLDLAYSPKQFLQSSLNGILIFSFLWFLYKSVDLLSDLLEIKLGGESEINNLQHRKFQTSSIVIRRTLKLILILIGMSVVFMQFDEAKQIGVSLLASAGLAGIALGLAAQKTLGTIFAGIQLVLTQPVRIGDNVVVEKEFGLVEEIHFTFIVIRTRDLRRLIVPISYFLEKPFENWTKISSETVGNVLLYVRYATPIDILKKEATQFIFNHPLFTHIGFGIQIIETNPSYITVQIQSSGKTPEDCSKLQMELREHMVGFLKDWEDGRFLP
ncbi:mechanosensitive ion channel family protein [Leptospira sp. 'Mane']|uniref:mechanosensitive ion channel family protein n=1 Tax=Leptospira sp. 'Mane' TaxID=3387407 RepID=UPI00398ACDA8